jgi:hypothetical protein
MLKRFTIFGERCSGTNFLEESILINFEAELTWDYGHKHFFGFNGLRGSDDTLFICLVRHGYTWINSLRNRPFHFGPAMLKDNESFLTNPVVSFHPDGSLMQEDMNIKTHEPYSNIYELRRVKIDFMTKQLPRRVKNYLFFRYEDLCTNFHNHMSRVAAFLQPRPTVYIQPTWYKKDRGMVFIRSIKRYVSKEEFYNHPGFELIRDQEKELGYLD